MGNTLFWLNYFPPAYHAALPRAALAGISARVQPLDDGAVLVQLADEPWDTVVAVLGEDGAYHQRKRR